MSETNDTETGGVERSCPECGGETTKGRATQKYGYVSCIDCPWYDYIEDGEYVNDGGTCATGVDQ